MPVFDGFAEGTADCLINLEKNTDYNKYVRNDRAQCLIHSDPLVLARLTDGSAPDVMAYLALLGRNRGRKLDRFAPATAREVERGRTYLAEEYARGVGHFIDPDAVPSCTFALPRARVRISDPSSQSSRPGYDAMVAPWAGFLYYRSLATNVSRWHAEAHHENLDRHKYKSCPDLLPQPKSPSRKEQMYLQFPFRRHLITVSCPREWLLNRKTNIRAPFPYGVFYPAAGRAKSTKYVKVAAAAYNMKYHPISLAFFRPWYSYYLTDQKNIPRMKFGPSNIPVSDWDHATDDGTGYPIDLSPQPVLPGWDEEHEFAGVDGYIEYL